MDTTPLHDAGARPNQHKYIAVNGDDGSIRVIDTLEAPELYREDFVYEVPHDFVLSIPLDKMSDPYLYEYLDNHPQVKLVKRSNY
jgi:hypothetical protein